TTGAITLVSTDSQGATTGRSYYDVAFSPDGKRLAFVSTSTPGPFFSGGSDVVVKDLVAGTLTVVSSGVGGSYAAQPVFSPDGQKVAFKAVASDFVPGAASTDEIVVRDLTTNAIAIVSTDLAGNDPNNYSEQPVFSPDGKKIAFASVASNLVASDVNG